MLTSNISRKLFHANSPIFLEGEESELAFIIESGLVEISKVVGGDKIVLGTLGDNEIFGELASLDGAPRMATARALKDTTCLVVPESGIRRRLRKADPLMRALIRILVRTVRTSAKRFADEASAGPPRAAGRGAASSQPPGGAGAAAE